MQYEEVIRDAKLLAHKICDELEDIPWKAIHPIPAGGIAIGVAMSEILELPLLSTGEYKEYKKKHEVLVVDDLVDSGKTLLRYPRSDTAVLYRKIHCQVPTTFYLKEIGSEWVTFPHEKDKDGILDHVIRVFSFINVQLSEDEENVALNILNKLKK